MIYISDILSRMNNGKSTGHFFSVARNYQEIFGESVIVVGGPIYSSGFSKKKLLLLPYNASGKNRIKIFINAIKLFKYAKGNIIVMQQCAVITTFLCIALFYHKTSKLFLIQYSNEGFRLSLGKFLFRFAKNKIDGIICPNKDVGEQFSGLPYCVVPDYIYTGETEKQDKPYEERKYDFCIVGRIAPEKGVIEAALALSKTSYSVLIAGKAQDSDLEKALLDIASCSPNITLYLGYVSDEDYYAYIRDSKFAILNYSNAYSERSSGVVFDTLFNGTPVLGRMCKSLKFIEEKGLGYVFDDISSFDFSKVISPIQYEIIISEIRKYRDSHNKYVFKLKQFILN